MQESQLIRSATLAGRGKCRRRRLGLAFGTAVVLLLAFAQVAFALPQTTIDSGPSGFVNSSDVSFTFLSDTGTSFKCSLDGAGFGACSSPADYFGLSEGAHTFAVRAIDASGADDTPDTRSFTVDTIAPDAPVLTGPFGPAKDSNPKVTGSVGSDTLTGVQIYTNDSCAGTPAATGTVADFTATGIAVAVPNDQTTIIAAKVVDEAGNASACSSPIAYTQDSTPPETQIDSGPSGTIKTGTVTFTFASSEPTASFECTLDGTSEACTSPRGYSNLPAGDHTFSVRSIDQAGNSDPTAATVSFRIDLSVPSASSTPTADPAPVGTSSLAARPAASFVLIGGRAIKVNRNRAVSVRLNCSGTKECSGRVVLTTASGIRFHRHKLLLRLGSARFSMPAAVTAKVKIRLSKAKYRLLKRLKRAKVLVTVTDVDRAGRARVSTREITLRA